MKRLVFVVTMVLLALVVLSATGCSTKATPSKEIKGTLKDINTPAEAGADTITVKTPEGDKTIPITGSTAFSIGGKVCTIDQVDALNLGNASYNCTIVLDVDGIIVGIDVTKSTP